MLLYKRSEIDLQRAVIFVYASLMRLEGKLHNQITIIVPVSRMSTKLDNLRQWLRTVDFESIEVILVHDIQDVETGRELKEITFKIPKIQLIEARFGSPGMARNAGLDLVKSEWIVFWDSDDLPEVEEVIEMIEIAANGNFAVAVGGFTVQSLTSPNLHSLHLIENSISGKLFEEFGMQPGLWRWAFRKEIIGKIRFKAFRMAEDQCFLFDLNLAGQRIYVHPKSVYTYFVGDEQQLTNNSKALSDLLKSVPYLMRSIKGSNASKSEFGALLITRQVLTALKRGVLSTKILMIIQVMKFFPLILFSKGAYFMAALKLLVTKRSPLFHEK